MKTNQTLNIPEGADFDANPQDETKGEIAPANKISKLPLFSDETVKLLPDLLSIPAAFFESKVERDVFLVSAFAHLAAVMPNVHTRYGKELICPQVFLFVSGRSGSGKGAMNFARQLVLPVDQELRKRTKEKKEEHERLMLEYKAACKRLEQGKTQEEPPEEPKEPPQLLLLIPAETSKAGIIKLLDENDGQGLISETEGDTLSEALSRESGRFSDTLRKCFGHERIAKYNKVNNESYLTERPNLSVCLSGTPEQLQRLIPSPENGLFSRFLFYNTQQSGVEFQDPWSEAHNGFTERIQACQKELLDIYYHLKGVEQPFTFELTDGQKESFRGDGEKLKKLILEEFNAEDLVGTVHRFMIIQLRLCMIVAVLRAFETGEINPILQLEDLDFLCVDDLMDTLWQHMIENYKEMPSNKQKRTDTGKRSFAKRHDQIQAALDLHRKGNGYGSISEKLGVPKSTVQGWIKNYSKNGDQ